MTTEEKLLEIYENEGLTEEFFTHFSDEMNSDYEPLSAKMNHLASVYYNNKELIDDIFITLCGWSIDSLCNMTLEIKTK